MKAEYSKLRFALSILFCLLFGNAFSQDSVSWDSTYLPDIYNSRVEQFIILIQSLLPVNDTFNILQNHCNKGEEIGRINNQLKYLANQEKVTFIDLHMHLKDNEGKLKKEYNWDGVYLTLAGYHCWLNVLRKCKYL